VDNAIFPQQMLVDYVRVYQDASTGIDDPVSKDNPVISSFFSDKISIEFPDTYSPLKTISLIDIHGRIIRTNQTSDSKTEIESGFLSKGMYLVKINSGNRTYTQKVIKN